MSEQEPGYGRLRPGAAGTVGIVFMMVAARIPALCALLTHADSHHRG
ncbi:MAG: hypothetical protein ACR2GU_15295 [Rubrobacteraceae bacterium]